MPFTLRNIVFEMFSTKSQAVPYGGSNGKIKISGGAALPRKLLLLRLSKMQWLLSQCVTPGPGWGHVCPSCCPQTRAAPAPRAEQVLASVLRFASSFVTTQLCSPRWADWAPARKSTQMISRNSATAAAVIPGGSESRAGRTLWLQRRTDTADSHGRSASSPPFQGGRRKSVCHSSEECESSQNLTLMFSAEPLP